MDPKMTERLDAIEARRGRVAAQASRSFSEELLVDGDVPTLLAALRGVLREHAPTTASSALAPGRRECSECRRTYPCPTVRAVEFEVTVVDV